MNNSRPNKKRTRIEMMDLDKSLDKDDKIESEAPTPQTKSKYIGI